MATTLTALVARIAMDTSQVEAGSKQVRADLNRVNGVFRSMQTEQDKLTQKAESLQRQLLRGAITAEDHAKAMAFLEEKFKKLNDEASGLTQQLEEEDAVIQRLMKTIEGPIGRIASDFRLLESALNRGTISVEQHGEMVAKLTSDYMDATGQTKKFATETTSDFNRVNRIIAKTETTTERIQADFASLNRLYRRGKISAEEYARGVDKLNKEFANTRMSTRLVNQGVAKLTALFTPQRVALVAATAALAGLAAAVAAVVKAYDIATDKMAELDPIIKQSRAMGELTENVQSLAFALSESAGMSIEETGQSLMELQKRLGEAQLGTGEAANALKILGMTAEDLAKQSPAEQFRTVAAALQGVEDATMRAYLADKLFAEQGKKLVNGLMQSKQTLAEAEAQARAYGLTVDKFQAAGIEAANDQLARVRSQIDGIVTQFSAELAPALQFFASELQGILPLAGNMRMEFEIMVDTLVAAQAMARSFSAGLLDGLVSLEGYGSEIGDAIAPDDVATVLKKFHEMRDAAREAANQATEARKANMATEVAAEKVKEEYDKQVKALKDQIDALNGIDVAHQNALNARKEMGAVQREYLAILDQQLEEEKKFAKQKEKEAKAEEKRLEDIEALRQRGQEMITQSDPAKMMEKQLADLNVLLSVLGESFRGTYDREVQKIISDAAKAKLGDAERPGLIEAGTQGAVDVMQQGIFDAQEKQLQVQEEQKLLQEAQLAAQQETNRRLSELGLVTAIR